MLLNENSLVLFLIQYNVNKLPEGFMFQYFNEIPRSQATWESHKSSNENKRKNVSKINSVPLFLEHKNIVEFTGIGLFNKN